MNDMILDTKNYCSPIYTVDQSSPHYEAVWKLFGHLGCPEELAKSLLGHSDGSVASRYGSGYTLDVMREAMAKAC